MTCGGMHAKHGWGRELEVLDPRVQQQKGIGLVAVGLFEALWPKSRHQYNSGQWDFVVFLSYQHYAFQSHLI